MSRRFASLTPRLWIRTVMLLTGRELREALSSRWFLLYSLVFAGLGLCVSYVSATSVGGGGMAGYGRTSAGLINLVLLVVPLMALTAGAGSVSGDCERGTLAYLLTQPIRRWEILLGKFLGLSVAIATAICLGFGASAAILAFQGDHMRPGPFLFLVGISILLSLSMLSIGLLISVTCRRAAVATGVAVFVWLLLVFATDLGLMAGALAANLSIEALFKLATASPLQAFKMWSLQGVEASLDVLGPAGLYAQSEFKSALPWIFATVLSAWVIGPLLIASVIFHRRTPL